MALVPCLVGIASGVFCRSYANALNKQRLLAAPWRHVASGIVGGIAGYYYFKVEDYYLAEVNGARIKRGMPPLDRKNLMDFDQGANKALKEIEESQTIEESE
mmetsp:Transcript_4696/g.4839  ORF Transcript_4696/g.4839 Transcript_4696/m.4839 type:complete len:102 (+) Transcript_4696:113-418(+)